MVCDPVVPLVVSDASKCSARQHGRAAPELGVGMQVSNQRCLVDDRVARRID